MATESLRSWARIITMESSIIPKSNIFFISINFERQKYEIIHKKRPDTFGASDLFI